MSSKLRERRNLRLTTSLSIDNNCSKILPHLYLGGHEMTTDCATLRTLNISHILSITIDSYNHYPGEFAYQQLPILDSVDANILHILPMSIQFIESAKEAGGACLVHCSFGMSRSPSIVLGYLMHTEQMSLAQAVRKVKGSRPVTAPNYGFMQQLANYEIELRGKVSVDCEKYRENRTAVKKKYFLFFCFLFFVFCFFS